MGILRYVRNQWDRIGAWGCVAAGLIALLVGYFGVSGTLETGEQIPYVVSGGLVGLFLLGLGALLWLSADLRDEWRKLDAIDRHMTEVSPDRSRSTTQLPSRGAGGDSSKDWVVRA